MIYDGKKWNLQLTENVIDNLYDNKKSIIEDNISNFADSLNESQHHALERWINTPEEDKKISQIKEEFKLLLFNKRNIINDKNK